MESGLGRQRVLDLTREQTNPPFFRGHPRHWLVRSTYGGAKSVVQRHPRRIDSVCLHQAGETFDVSAVAVHAAGGDALLAKHRRALASAAHMVVFDTGYAVLGSPLEWYVYHGGPLNARSIGVEIEGVFPERMEKPLMPEGQLAAAWHGLRFVVQMGRAAGMPLKYVFAHRQSALTRPDDPGEEIWRRVVVDFAVPELGLEPLPDAAFGGLPIPREWGE